MQDDRSDDRSNRPLRQSHLGLQFVLTIGLSSFLGLKADERFGTKPVFTLLGALLGFGVGFYYLYVGVYGRPRAPRARDVGDRPDEPAPPPP